RGVCFFFSSRRRHTRSKRDWSSDVCSSDLAAGGEFTLLLRRLVGWHGARIFVFVLGTHGGAPSDLVGDVQGVSNLEAPPPGAVRSEEHTSELQSRFDLVCRLLLEKKNEKTD